MMKKVSIAPLLLCLLSGITSCSVENDLQTGKSKSIAGDAITITAGREDSSTRAVLNSENDKETFWEAADKLTIWVGDGSTFTNSNKSDNFKLISGEGRKAAQFRGNPVYTAEPTDETILTAVQDRDDDFVDCSDGTTATVDFSTQQYGTLESVLKYDAFYATTTWSERFFSFRHTMSFVRWTIHVPNITEATTCSILLRADNLINKAQLDLSTGKLSSTNKGDITLTDVSLDASGNAVLYVALFPGQTTSRMTAIVMLADGKMTVGQLGTFNSFTFNANKLYRASWTFKAPKMPVYRLEVWSPGQIQCNDSPCRYMVHSSAFIDNIYVPVAWTITNYKYYHDDNGDDLYNWTYDGSEKPSWLIALSQESGRGVNDYNQVEVGWATVENHHAPVDGNPDNPFTTLLKNAKAKSNYDLSQGGETANCYVISAPGTYKIPLIIGNARKADGTVNDVCFNKPDPYVTYKGNAITSMWLKEHGGTPTSGSLVWSDCGDNIVSNLNVSGDFLTFSVSADNIKQGNAVVAVKDEEGKIMWSWHLWFTDSDALSTIAFNNASNETLYFTRDNLGFVYDEYYPHHCRQVNITVTQAHSNKTAIIWIMQHSGISPGFRSPGSYRQTHHDTKYQFGRKDAFSGSYHLVWQTTDFPEVTYQNTILNPGVFYHGRYSDNKSWGWCSANCTDGWAVGISRPNPSLINPDRVLMSAIVKSVYDPCPAGFKIPTYTAFTGFSSRNCEWDKRRNGQTFTDSKNGTSVFFPFTSYRYVNGYLDESEQYGRYWSAIPYNTRYGYFFDNVMNSPELKNGAMSYGCSVRPVKDR